MPKHSIEIKIIFKESISDQFSWAFLSLSISQLINYISIKVPNSQNNNKDSKPSSKPIHITKCNKRNKNHQAKEWSKKELRFGDTSTEAGIAIYTPCGKEDRKEGTQKGGHYCETVELEGGEHNFRLSVFHHGFSLSTFLTLYHAKPFRVPHFHLPRIFFFFLFTFHGFFILFLFFNL